MNQKSKILVVDDTETNLILIEDLLTDEGYEVRTSSTGIDALELVNSDRIDLILLDIMMPNMDGFQVCSAIKANEKTREIPIIFFTARIDSDSLRKGFDLGAVDYVKKPYSTVELLARVRTHLELKLAKDKIRIELNERKKAENRLRISQVKYKTLFASANDSIFLLNNDLIVNCNNKAQQKFVIDPNTYRGKSFLELSEETSIEDKNKNEYFAEMVKKAIEKGGCRFDWKNRNIEGEVFYTDISLSKLELDGKIFIQAIVRDVSKQKEYERQIRESEEKYRTLFNKNYDAVFIYHIENERPGKFIEVNDTACLMFGYTHKEFSNLSSHNIVSEDFREGLAERFQEIMRRDTYVFEADVVTKEGKPIPCELTAGRFMYKGKLSVLTVVRDISDRKEMQRKIMTAIINTEEKERDRFAKDLHDGLGALLSSINMYLNMIELGKITCDELPNAVVDMKNLLQEAVQSSKDISNNIRPNVLTNFGFIPSLEAFCRKLNNTQAINVVFDTSEFRSVLEEDSEVILFRIINELINNTLKHANAKNISLNIITTDEDLVLEYSDDGVGFDVENTLKTIDNKSMGLQNIINRTKTINGKCDISSSLGEGFKVRISVHIDS